MILVNQQDVINDINEWIKSSEYYKDNNGIFLLQMVRDTIEKLPTQEIIHCENCEHWDTSWETVHGLHYCPMIDLSTKKDFFCKYGAERKGE